MSGAEPARAARIRRRVLLTTLVAVALFAGLALLVGLGLTASLDRTVLLSLRVAGRPDDPLGPHWFEEMAGDYTALGSYALLCTFSFVAVAILLLMGRRHGALYLVAALASGSAMSVVLKGLFARPRPDLVAHADRVFTASFPSAHAMVATVGWLTLAAVSIRFIEQQSVRRFVLGMAVAIAGVVGVSRVYLGVHWPSDVLAGWSVGVAWAGLCWLVADWLERKTGRDTQLGHSRT